MIDHSLYAPGLYPPALEPAAIHYSPGKAFSEESRQWQGCPTIARTPGGRLWAGWYSGGIKEPDEDNYNLLVYSDDNGSTWSEPVLVIESIPGQCLRAIDIQLWIDPRNRLWVFWTQTRDSKAKDESGRCVKYTDDVFGVFAMVTEDVESDTPRFDAPRRLSDGFLRCRPTVLSSGIWLMCPYDWLTNRLAYCISADEGQTWLRQYGAVRCGETTFDEQMVVERNDGGIWMLWRTKQGALGQSFSYNGGRTWTPAGLSTIPNPSSRFWIDRLPSGRLLLINHHNFTGRSHMTALLSEDDGISWKYTLLLDERSGVSYPDAAIAPDGQISIVYDCGRCAEKEILLAQIREADILAGKPVSADTRLRHIISKAPSATR